MTKIFLCSELFQDYRSGIAEIILQVHRLNRWCILHVLSTITGLFPTKKKVSSAGNQSWISIQCLKVLLECINTSVSTGLFLKSFVATSVVKVNMKVLVVTFKYTPVYCIGYT